MDLAAVVQSVAGTLIVGLATASAKFLRDIASELHGIKTAMAVTKDRVDSHSETLEIHDSRIRTLETRGRKG